LFIRGGGADWGVEVKKPTATVESEDELPEVTEESVLGLSEQVRVYAGS